jgi:ankyrin repeat protein
MTDHQLKNAFPAEIPSEKEVDDFFDAVTKGNLSGTRAFLDKYPSCINQPIINSAPPLIRAVIYKQIWIVHVLLSKGADADAKDLSDWTPLIYAAREGQTEMIDLLLQNGASIDMKIESSGMTALMFAVCEDRSDSVRLLLEKGATLDETDNNGKTALTRAKEGGKLKTAALIGKWQEMQQQRLSDGVAELRAKELAAAQLEKLKSRRPPASPFKKNKL